VFFVYPYCVLYSVSVFQVFCVVHHTLFP
jgi:hypothetical protein